MTIYFDENKQAYSFEISNPIAIINDEVWELHAADKDSWDIINGEFTDLRQSTEYLANIAAKEKEARVQELIKQIDELDKKRIRAIAEPAIKDESTGETWLEYYTSQIQELRTRLIS
jgi:hypothetical protein